MSGAGFVEAEKLGIGCQIVTRAGPALVVQAVEWKARPEGYLVYNFEVQDDHTYFVGQVNGGAWVHNPGGPCDKPLVTILGRLQDTAEYMGKEGANVIRFPKDEYTWAKNVSELAKAYRRGDTFEFVTSKSDFGKYSKAELKLLEYWRRIGRRPVNIRLNPLDIGE